MQSFGLCGTVLSKINTIVREIAVPPRMLHNVNVEANNGRSQSMDEASEDEVLHVKKVHGPFWDEHLPDKLKRSYPWKSMYDSGSESDEPVVVASKRLRLRCVHLYRISDTPNAPSKKSHSKKITSKVNITKSDNGIDVSKEGTHRLYLKHKRRSCFTCRKRHKALKKGDEPISGQSNDYSVEDYLQ